LSSPIDAKAFVIFRSSGVKPRGSLLVVCSGELSSSFLVAIGDDDEEESDEESENEHEWPRVWLVADEVISDGVTSWKAKHEGRGNNGRTTRAAISINEADLLLLLQTASVSML
jgi:hypothetical protein